MSEVFSYRESNIKEEGRSRSTRVRRRRRLPTGLSTRRTEDHREEPSEYHGVKASMFPIFMGTIQIRIIGRHRARPARSRSQSRTMSRIFFKGSSIISKDQRVRLSIFLSSRRQAIKENSVESTNKPSYHWRERSKSRAYSAMSSSQRAENFFESPQCDCGRSYEIARGF